MSIEKQEKIEDIHEHRSEGGSAEVLKLPALEVRNKVLWVNKDMELPFSIKKGESNKLGMFFTPVKKKSNDAYPLEVQPEHHRSGILGRVIFKDKQGNLYRDVDLKGVGYTYSGKVKQPLVDASDSYQSDRSWGILEKAYAENDIKKSEQFLKAGIRTYRPIALIKLEEIIDQMGDIIPIKAAENRGMLVEDSEPVVEVRAFGTRARIADLNTNDIDLRESMIRDAMNLVAKELSKDPDKFSKAEYMDWFIKNLATSLARMHYRNWIHGYLTTHNITLDARIIDLDSVETIQEIMDRKKSGEVSRKSFDRDKLCIIETIFYLQEKMNYYFKIDAEGLFNEICDKELKRLRNQTKK